MNTGILTTRDSPPLLVQPLLGRPSVTPIPDQALHPDTNNWLQRVAANGGFVTKETIGAVNSFCYRIEAANIRDRFWRLNLFCGENLAAALVPLYVAENNSAAVRGGRTDTNFNFVSGDFNNRGPASGLKGNGTNKYLNTALNANLVATLWDGHLGLGMAATDTRTAARYTTGIGCYVSSSPYYTFQLDIRRNDPTDIQRCCTFGWSPWDATAVNRTAGIFNNTAVLPSGYYVATWPYFCRNGTQFGAVSTQNEAFLTTNQSIPVFCQRISSSGPTSYTDARYHWYSIGKAINIGHVPAFDAALVSFAAALNRT